MARRGRNRKPGERYPSGNLRPRLNPIAPAAWERIRKDIAKEANNPLLESELGRLLFHRELTSTQIAAGFRVAAIYSAYERLEHINRSSRSASYESGLRGEMGIPEEYMAPKDLTDLIEQERLIKSAYRELQSQLHRMQCPKQLKDALEQLCAGNTAINPTRLGEVGKVLDRLAIHFGVTKSMKRAAQGPRPASARKVPAKRDDLDRAAFCAVVRKLRPDLSYDQAIEAHEFQRALKARAVARRGKEQQRENVVYLPAHEPV